MSSFKPFTLANGDVLFEKPSVIYAVQGTHFGFWKFDIALPTGASVQYRSERKVEVERERARLLEWCNHET